MKYFALLIAFLVVASPMAYADNHDSMQLNVDDRRPQVTATQIKDAVEGLDPDAALNECMKLLEGVQRTDRLKAEACERILDLDPALISMPPLPREEVGEKIRERVEDIAKKREITRERVELARNRLEDAREKYEEAQERKQERRERFDEAKERVRLACEDETSVACEEARAQAFERAKEFLLNRADAMIAQLEEMVSNIESEEGINQERAAKNINLLNEKLTVLTEIRSEIENADGKDTLKEAGLNLAEAWKRMKVSAVDHRLDIIEARVKVGVRQVMAYEAALDRILVRMENNGYEVSEIQDEIDEFMLLVDSAETNWAMGKEKFSEFRSSDNPSDNKELLDEANEYFKAAHEDVKEANKVLRDIRREIADLMGEETDLDDEEVEIEVEDDELPPRPPRLEEEFQEFERERNYEELVLPNNIVDMVNDLASMLDSDVELEYEVKKGVSEVKTDEEVEGTLNTEQQDKWDEIKRAMDEYLSEYEGEYVKVEAEIEYEMEDMDDDSDEEMDVDSEDETDDDSDDEVQQ